MRVVVVVGPLFWLVVAASTPLPLMVPVVKPMSFASQVIFPLPSTVPVMLPVMMPFSSTEKAANPMADSGWVIAPEILRYTYPE